MDTKMETWGRNPILPLNYHIPDCEARVMPDGRLYLFGSCDIDPSFYCSEEYQVFSTDDMIHWQAHGRSFCLSEIPKEGKNTVPEALWLSYVDCFADGDSLYFKYIDIEEQKQVSVFLKDEGCADVRVYLDDILIYGKEVSGPVTVLTGRYTIRIQVNMPEKYQLYGLKVLA